MDERTREKYLRAARIMLHAFEGHRSRLPQSAHLATVVVEGLKAAQALGIEAVTRELRCELEQARALEAALTVQTDTATQETPKQAVKPETPKKPASKAHRYPERKCCHCGKDFWPEYYNSAYCSDVCRRAAHRAKYSARAAATPSLPAPAEALPQNHCDRLHVTTMQPLPCGKREECFGENPCQFVPDRKQRASGSQWTKPIPIPSPLVREAFGIGCGLPAGDM